MSDFNMVNVESQGQVGKSLDTVKLLHLARDLHDHHQFLPVLKELQLTASKVVKEFHEYLSRKEKKQSLPYNMIRKFQLLKGHFFRSSQVLDFQNRLYLTQVGNRDYDKMHEQLFFKKTLKSYDEKRLWMKHYILSNEAMVQAVEEVVKQNVEFEVHQFTEHRNELNIERLEHNYDNKLEQGQRCQQLLRRNAELREQVRKRLASKIQSLKDRSGEELPPQNKQEPHQQRANSSKSISLANFFNFYVTKQYIRNQFLRSETARLRNSSKQLSQHNQSLKLAIDKAQQRLEFSNSEAAIIHQQPLLHQSSHRQSGQQPKRLTKTDYLIYLKEIQRHCDQVLKIYGLYFVYSLSQKPFPNALRSKSASKHYAMKPASPQVKLHCGKRLKEEFLAYREENKERIVRSKLERQQKRKAEEERKRLVLNSLEESREEEKEKKSVQSHQQANVSEQAVLPLPPRQQTIQQLQLQEEEFHYI